MKLKNIDFFLHFLTTGHLEVVNYLLDNGSKIDAKSRSGRTPLYCAAFNGHFEVVKCLIENGAEAEAKSKCGRTPIHAAEMNKHKNIANFLKNFLNFSS